MKQAAFLEVFDDCDRVAVQLTNGKIRWASHLCQDTGSEVRDCDKVSLSKYPQVALKCPTKLLLPTLFLVNGT